jgi:hypothetical protein
LVAKRLGLRQSSAAFPWTPVQGERFAPPSGKATPSFQPHQFPHYVKEQPQPTATGREKTAFSTLHPSQASNLAIPQPEPFPKIA